MSLLPRVLAGVDRGLERRPAVGSRPRGIAARAPTVGARSPDRRDRTGGSAGTRRRRLPGGQEDACGGRTSWAAVRRRQRNRGRAGQRQGPPLAHRAAPSRARRRGRSRAGGGRRYGDHRVRRERRGDRAQPAASRRRAPALAARRGAPIRAARRREPASSRVKSPLWSTSLSGAEPKPAFRARPFERGVRRRPTLVQNVETLAHLALIVRHGAGWYRQAGTAADPGSTLVTLSGAVASPGVYEIEHGAPLADLLASAGQTEELAAVLIGGYFGSWLPARAIPQLRLSPTQLAEHGVGARRRRDRRARPLRLSGS